MLDKKTTEKSSTEETSSIEKELFIHSSLIQKKLLKTTAHLNETIVELTKTLKNIEKHEYLTMHKNKWKLIAYNIFLGMLFAIGTVFGLVLLSWFTVIFFKDSAILNQIVQNQLKIRQMDISEIREKVKNDLIKPSISSSGTTGSGQK